MGLATLRHRLYRLVQRYRTLALRLRILLGVASAYQTYLYTDRPVYRSGQPVYFRGVVRSKDDVVYMPAPLDTVPVVIRDARGEIVYERELALSEFGSFSGQFDIAPGCLAGRLQPDRGSSKPNDDIHAPEGGSIGFLVAEYRLPEYQVTRVDRRSPQMVQGDTGSRSTVAGEYFFGGPVSAPKVIMPCTRPPITFEYQGDGRYDFADSDVYQDGA